MVHSVYAQRRRLQLQLLRRRVLLLRGQRLRSDGGQRLLHANKLSRRRRHRYIACRVNRSVPHILGSTAAGMTQPIAGQRSIARSKRSHSKWHLTPIDATRNRLRFPTLDPPRRRLRRVRLRGPPRKLQGRRSRRRGGSPRRLLLLLLTLRLLLLLLGRTQLMLVMTHVS